jgi:hypothetical protein
MRDFIKNNLSGIAVGFNCGMLVAMLIWHTSDIIVKIAILLKD